MSTLFAKLSLWSTSALLVLLWSSLGANAQSTPQGSVEGLVTDPSGAVVANARITLSNEVTHAELQASSKGSGAYSIPAVPAGGYTLTIEALGFARYRQAPVQVAAAPLTVDVKLTLESATQSVTVQGEDQSLEQVPNVGKTGTKLEDIPISVQVINRELANAQGAVGLQDTIRNSSGVVQGGGDGFGFGDRFQIRGLEARIYNDGFSDGDERNGIPHSLNGVERVEILEGPGSSLFGTGPPGGTINVVHFTPSPTFSYGGAFQTGSFGLVSGGGYINGAIATKGLSYRVDGLAQHKDGFRSLTSADYELRPAVSWTRGNNVFLFVVDGRELRATPDPAGLLYLNGTPITSVSRNAFYSTPFGYGDQALARVLATDTWMVNPHLTVSNRFSYMYRNLPILRNGDGGTIAGTVFSGRQLRRQHDILNDFDYEAEPVWSFKTGRIHHSLLTGFEVQHQGVVANRATADLPNIANIFDPVVPETSTAGLVFLQDAKHSGFLDDLSATYTGVYATDQIDLTSRWKLRAGGREDIWKTQLTPTIFVPGRILTGTQLIEPPNVYKREDNPFSWNVGTVYRVLPGVSPFFGVARSNLVNFSSEATQNGLQAPESGLQYEAGVKVAAWGNRLQLTASAFDVKRNNVFSLVGDVPVFNDQKTVGGEGNIQLLLGRGWHISANGTGMHPSLTDNPSSPAATGKRPQGVPEHIFNLWTSYDLRWARLSGLTVAGGVTERDRMFGDLLNTKSIPSYTTLDTVLSYTRPTWNASLGFRNLTDQRYFTAANGAGGFVGEPRSFFVAVRKNFGSHRD